MVGIDIAGDFLSYNAPFLHARAFPDKYAAFVTEGHIASHRPVAKPLQVSCENYFDEKPVVQVGNKKPLLNHQSRRLDAGHWALPSSTHLIFCKVRLFDTCLPLFTSLFVNRGNLF